MVMGSMLKVLRMTDKSILRFAPDAKGAITHETKDLKAYCTGYEVDSRGAVYLGREFTGDEVVVMVIRV